MYKWNWGEKEINERGKMGESSDMGRDMFNTFDKLGLKIIFKTNK